MFKSKYVLAYLAWSSRCLLGTFPHTTFSNASLNPGTIKQENEGMTDVYMQYTAAAVTGEGMPPEAYPTLEEKRVSTEAERHPIAHSALHKEAIDSLKQPSAPTAVLASTNATSTASYVADTAPDAVPAAPQSPIQTIVQYTAESTIVFDVKQQTIQLHGTGNIKYDTIELEAEEISIDWAQYTIRASSKKNEAGNVAKKTVLTKDGVEYIAESVCYNFGSQRAIANRLFTQQGDGILRAKRIKKDTETIFYADRGTYTTCNLAHPHFHVDARRLKIDQQDVVISGPFRLYFDGVPTPLGFPYGIFYLPKGSGIIPPKYGGESEKGFCLRDGGYYIKFNDCIDLALRASLYSKSSTEFTAETNYKKRYQYSGNIRFGRHIYLTSDESRLSRKIKGWRFLWQHGTENNKTSSWHVYVDLVSQNAYGTGLLQENERYQTAKESSIRYTNTLVGFPLPYTIDSSLRLHTSRIGETYASLPEITLGTSNIYPFGKKGALGTNWYSNIYLQHKLELHNKLSNSIDSTLDFLDPKDWYTLSENSKQGVRHTIPLQTNIKILTYLNLAPQLTYQERWYWEKKEYKYNAQGDIQADMVPGFARVYDYGAGATLKTTCYGTKLFGRNATVQAIRHQISPILTFTYTPDFSGPEYGYWQTIKGGDQNGKKLDRFEGAVYPSPGIKDTAVLAINLNNRLDMKVKSRTNAQETTKKVPILESFDWSTSYDFLADQHAWGDIQFKTRTHLLDKRLSIEFESVFDPYCYEHTNHATERNERKYMRSNNLAWNHGEGLGHVKNASLSISASLGSRDKNEILDEQYGEQQEEPGVRVPPQRRLQDSQQYVDFRIPWKLYLDYNWHYTCPNPGSDPMKTNSLGFEWHVSLTEKWKVTCKSAYDLQQRKFVGNATSIGIYRDLHCWEMNFNWNPLGDKQIYKFSIGLKAPLLKDLKYSRDREYTKY